MDWRTLNHDYLMAAVAGGGFLLGMLLTVLSRSRKSEPLSEDPRNAQIRQLEADLRITETRLQKTVEKLDNRNGEYDDTVSTIYDLEGVLVKREQETEKLRQEVKAAVKKTKDLRLELTDRATETIREKAKVKEYETELEVARAGTAVMADEFYSHQDEEESGSGSDDMLDDESLLGDASSS